MNLRGITKFVSQSSTPTYPSINNTTTTALPGTEAMNPLGVITETPSGIDINNWWLSKV